MGGSNRWDIACVGLLLAVGACATSSTLAEQQDAGTVDSSTGTDAGVDAGGRDGNRLVDAPDDVVTEADTSTDSGDAADAAVTRLLVFTTSQSHNGAFAGLAGADAFCQSRAVAAALPGTYKAWLSDTTGTPSTRFTHGTVPYALVDGTIVANDWTQLTSGTLLHAIDKSESNGAPAADNSGLGLPQGVSLVWTSTKFDGTAVAGTDCVNWTSSTANQPSEWGRDDETSVSWSQWASSGSCAWVAPLMCFQQ